MKTILSYLFFISLSIFIILATIIVGVIFVMYIRYFLNKHKRLNKEQASKYIGKIVSKDYSLNSVKGDLIREELLYNYDNGCDTKESLDRAYVLAVNKIVYFGRGKKKNGKSISL